MSEFAITGAAVERYLYAMLPPSAPVLAEMEDYAREHDVPIVGPAVGRLLHLLALLAGARRIFELGSAIGYSTLWWASAAGEEGEVYYTDTDAGNVGAARRYFERAGLGSRIRLRHGEALAALAATGGEFDVIFVDLEKRQYPEALRCALPRLRAGGLLVADNVLWSGRVAAPAADEETRAIAEFNRMLYAAPELYPVLVPLRDGVAVARKRR